MGQVSRLGMKVEGWMMKQRPQGCAGGQEKQWCCVSTSKMGETRRWEGRDSRAFINIHVASEPCQEQFILHASGSEHGIGIWCEVRHG